MRPTQRQHRIARLLETEAVASQARLVELLAAEGVTATQATVSRDLEELGAVKVRLPGGDMAYAVPEAPGGARAAGGAGAGGGGRGQAEHLRRVLGDWVVDVAWSANLVVLHTPPGSAHVVASALDRAGLEGVIGTLAGDDTALVVAADANGGAGLARRIASLAGL